jgi:predicted phage-related endonuclease
MAKVLVETKGMPKEKWIEWRFKGLGGSDASAVAGANKYKSALVLYMEKVGIYEAKPAGEAAYWGNQLEDIVAQEFIKRYNEELREKHSGYPDIESGEWVSIKPARIQKRNAILQHEEYEFMLANVDRFLICPIRGKGILEVKTASSYVSDEWKGEDVPNAYFIQVQHYLAITGLSYAFIAVLIGGNEFRKYYIPRDEEFIADLIQLEKNFWFNNVLAQIPPAIDGSDSTTEMYKVLYPTHHEGKTLELMADAIIWAEERENAKKQMDEWENVKKECENKIKSVMADAQEANAGFHRITWKADKRGVRPLKIKLDALKG